MRFFRYLQVALESIFAYKLRALLTLLGFVIGVAAVVSMFGLGRGLSSDIMGNVNDSTNLDLLELQPNMYFVNMDVTALNQKRFNPDLEVVVPLYRSYEDIPVDGQMYGEEVLGTTADYLSIKNLQLASGRFITVDDVAERVPVAVLGAIVADQLFSGQNPLGQTLSIKQETVQVVGVLAEKGGFDGQDYQIIVPLSTAQEVLFKAPRHDGSREISGMVIKVVDTTRLAAAKSQIEVTLRLQHGLKADMPNDFYLQSQREMLEMAQKISTALTLFLGSIGGISLVVAGIGIMNIMLVSVTERTREIGLRKAIGAHETDILLQFLLEALVFCLLGGSLGLALTYLVREAAALFSSPDFPIKILIEQDAIFLALGISVACGLVFGLYPAIRAARLSPMEALRSE